MSSKDEWVIGLRKFLPPAPIEITVACTMLYQYLGWSAFSGFFVLLVGWPLNSYMMKRSIRIQKGASTSRDKRMAVINELVGAVRSPSMVKRELSLYNFCFDIDQIHQVLCMGGSVDPTRNGCEGCGVEVARKMFAVILFASFQRSLISYSARTNSVMFSLLWTLSPILVSVVGFFTYVIQGNVLTVSTAFTVRQHFYSL